MLLGVALGLAAACGREGPTTSLQPGDASTADVDASDAPVRPDSGPVDSGAEPVTCGTRFDRFRTQAQIDSLDGCEVFLGHLYLTSIELDLSPLRSLRIVGGEISSGAQDRGVDFSGLESLEKVQATFAIGSPTRQLTGLERLRQVGAVVISGRSDTDIDLPALETVDELRINQMPELASLRGLASLREVELLVLEQNPSLPQSEIDAFLERVQVEEARIR